MTILTTAIIQALQTTVNQTYRAAFAAAKTLLEPAIVTNIPSSTLVGTYAWMDLLPLMREWIGPKTFNNMTNSNYQLTNRDWESSIECDRNHVEDDMLGIFAPKVQALGISAASLVERQAVAALQAGATTGLCHDGLSFFNTVHTLNPAATQSNNFTTTALTGPNYAAARAAMMAFVGVDGEPLNVVPNLLVVPPQLEATARTILNAEIVATVAGTASETNIWRNSCQLLTVPRLVNQATTWYLFDTSMPIKSLVWQNRKSPTLVAMDSPTDEAVFMTRQLRWSIEARGAMGYSLWFLAARCIA